MVAVVLPQLPLTRCRNGDDGEDECAGGGIGVATVAGATSSGVMGVILIVTAI